jgi:hypothetical protein
MESAPTSNEKFDALLAGPLAGTIDDLLDDLEALAPDVDVPALVAAVQVFRRYSEGRRRMIKALDRRDHAKVVELAKNYDDLIAYEATLLVSDRSELEDIRKDAKSFDARFAALNALTANDDTVTFSELLDKISEVVGD